MADSKPVLCPYKILPIAPENKYLSYFIMKFLSYFIMKFLSYFIMKFLSLSCLFVCVEVLRPSQPNGVMSSAVSLPNHTFTGQA